MFILNVHFEKLKFLSTITVFPRRGGQLKYKIASNSLRSRQCLCPTLGEWRREISEILRKFSFLSLLFQLECFPFLSEKQLLTWLSVSGREKKFERYGVSIKSKPDPSIKYKALKQFYSHFILTSIGKYMGEFMSKPAKMSLHHVVQQV